MKFVALAGFGFPVLVGIIFIIFYFLFTCSFYINIIVKYNSLNICYFVVFSYLSDLKLRCIFIEKFSIDYFYINSYFSFHNSNFVDMTTYIQNEI